MSLSLIIPTLNRYDLLANLLDGIAQWPKQPDEIIIIDQTAFALGLGEYPDLSNSQRNIRHLKVDFRGPCKARNVGAKLAQGDLLWFLDDDMSPASSIDLVAKICEHFKIYPRTVLTGVFSPDTVSFKMNSTYDALRHLSRNWNMIDNEYRFSVGVLGGNVAISRNLYFELGGFDEAFDPNGAFEDRDFGLRCFFRGIRVYQPAWLYLKHLGATTGGRRGTSQLENLFYFWSKYLDEDAYYINALGYWLSQRQLRFLRPVLRFVAIRIFHYPVYRSP